MSPSTGSRYLSTTHTGVQPMSKPSISTDQQGRPVKPGWAEIAERLVSALRLSAPPVAISFHRRLPEGAPTPAVAPYDAAFARRRPVGGPAGSPPGASSGSRRQRQNSARSPRTTRIVVSAASRTDSRRSPMLSATTISVRCVAGSRMGRRIRVCDFSQPGEGTGAGAAYNMKEE